MFSILLNPSFSISKKRMIEREYRSQDFQTVLFNSQLEVLMSLCSPFYFCGHNWKHKLCTFGCVFIYIYIYISHSNYLNCYSIPESKFYLKFLNNKSRHTTFFMIADMMMNNKSDVNDPSGWGKTNFEEHLIYILFNHNRPYQYLWKLFTAAQGQRHINKKRP